MEAKLYKLHFYLLCTLACFPILNFKVANGLLILFLLLSFGLGLFQLKQLNQRSSKELLFHSSIILMILIWSYVLDKSDEAKFYAEKSLSLLVFPLAFYFSPNRFSETQKRWFYLCFGVSTIAIVMYGLLKVGILFAQYLGPDKFWKNSAELFKDPSFSHLLRSNFEIFTNIHPTYACLFLGISFIFLLKVSLRSFKLISWNRRLIILTVLILLMVFQVILAARTPFIATLISSFVMFLLYQKRKRTIALFVATALLGSIAFVAFIPSFSARFKEVSISNLSLPNAQTQNSFNIRTGIYDCTFGIIKDHWLMGVGPGKLQAQLNQCYMGISKEVYQNQNYNTHNQFLDYWASMGILAPLLLLVNLIYLGLVNYRKKQFVAIALCVFFFICMCTENILLRHNGIVPFALIMGLFSFNYKERT